MSEETIVKLAALGIVGFVVIMAIASQVGISRADAVKACYEAARVNPKVTCEPENREEE